jgi:Cof subfamily protein (haloacid dehalogenase superfamily)
MKDNIKMIVCDLDGTLLRSDKYISAYSKEILSRCRESGIKVTYATGRGNPGREGVAPPELFDGRVTQNGALAKLGDTVVYKRLVPHKIARPLLIACDKRSLRTGSQIGEMHYTNFFVPDIWSVNYEAVDFSRHDKDAEKLYALINSPEDAEFIKEQLPEDLHLYVSYDGLAMVMHKEATKSKAVAELARIWGIAQSEIAAFGDDLNDIDMLSYAGTGVAMENALDEVKAAANYVCQSNDEDGVAEWIKANIPGS